MAFAVESQGQEYPPEYSTMVQANAGYGAYAEPLAPYGGYGSPDGIGAYAREAKGPARYRKAKPPLFASPILTGIQAVRGLGDDAVVRGETIQNAPSGFLLAAVALGLVLTGVGSYYVGKAVAPSRAVEGKYAWWGVVAGLVGGPLGLGIEAVVALEHKGR